MVKYQYMHTLEALIRWLDGHSDHYRHRIENYESPALSAVLTYASNGKPSPDLPKPGSSTYYKYRSLLKKRLVKEVSAIDPAKLGGQDRSTARIHCQQWLHAIEVVARHDGEAIAADLLKKIWQTADVYVFTDLKLAAVRWFWRLRATVPELVESLPLHPGESPELLAMCQYEVLAEQAYFLISREKSPSLVDVILEPEAVSAAITGMKAIPASADSYQLHIFRELTELRMDAHERNYEALLTRSQSLLAYLKRQSFQDTWALQRVYLNMLLGYAFTNNQPAFSDCLREALSCVSKGSTFWIKYYDMAVRLSLATGAFERSEQYFQEVVESKSLNGKPPELQEQWRVYAAYLKCIDRLQPEYGIEKAASKTFRLGKFMNETPVFSKDKQGMNIPILIVQFLFLLSQKKYHKLIDRAEALAKYQSRYLQQDEWFRSQCFMKMLMQLPANNFHRMAVERKTADWASRLNTNGKLEKEVLRPFEIVPYEMLWKWILESLDDQFHGKRKGKGRRRSA